MTIFRSLIMTLIAIAIFAVGSQANEADVVFVQVAKSGGYYDFDVTVKHADTGWKHYANWWIIRTEDGTELAKRVLMHPHEDEQPFTRGLDSSIKIPDDIKIVIVETHDLVHGYGGKTVKIDLTQSKGKSYKIN